MHSSSLPFLMTTGLVIPALCLLDGIGCGSATDEESPTPESSPTPTPVPALELAGGYLDDYGTEHLITSDTWVMGTSPDESIQHIQSYSNIDDYLIAQNDAEKSYFPGLWSRFEWTEYQGERFYCQLAYDAPSQEAAEAATGADRTNPAASGCGGFPWSRLSAYVTGVCSSGATDSDPFVDCVEQYAPAGDPASFYGYDRFPSVVYSAPVGGGASSGSTDVLTLGCGGSITVAFDEPVIFDGEGVDFLVFENPFYQGETTFVEPARVSVSADGRTWKSFPCAVDGSSTWPPTGCAGIQPVYSTPDNGIDPTDPATAGGDGFDLATVGLSEARYVRLVDVTEDYYGSSVWCGGTAGGFDLDAISIVNARP